MTRDISLLLSSKLLKESVDLYKDEFMLTIKVRLADHLLGIKGKPYDLGVFDFIKETYEKYSEIDDVIDCVIFILSCEINYMCRTYAHRLVTEDVSMEKAFATIKSEVENYVGFYSEYILEDFVWEDSVDYSTINRVLQQVEFVAKHRYMLAIDMYKRLLCRWYGYKSVESMIRLSILRMSEARIKSPEVRQLLCFELKSCKIDLKSTFYTSNCTLVGFKNM